MSVKNVIGSILLVVGIITIGIFLFLFVGMSYALDGDIFVFFRQFFLETPLGWIIFGIPFLICIVPGLMLLTWPKTE